ncbi:hypothetical protein D3C84_477700 [compost metagenome]
MAAEGPGLLAGPALVRIQHQLEIGAPVEQQADQRQLVPHGVASHLQLGLEGGLVQPLLPVLEQLLGGALNEGIGFGQAGVLLWPVTAGTVEPELHRGQPGGYGLPPGQLRQAGQALGLRLGQALPGETGQGGYLPPAVVDAHQQALSRHLHLAVKGQGLGKGQLVAIEGECHQGFRLYLEKSGRRFSLNALRPS